MEQLIGRAASGATARSDSVTVVRSTDGFGWSYFDPRVEEETRGVEARLAALFSRYPSTADGPGGND